MGKGRDKRKKHEDPEAAKKRASRQAAKQHRSEGKKTGEEGEEGTGGTGVALNGEEDITDTVLRFQRQEHRRKQVNEIDLPAGQGPSPRANCIWLPNPVSHTKDPEFLLFGGEFWDGEDTIPYNDLFLFNSTKNKWKRIQSPCAPCPRSSCQGWTHKHYLYVHGGEITSRTQSQFMHFKDLWRFDLNTYVWEEMQRGKGGPSARSGHRIVPYKRGCALFGGFFDNGQQTIYHDDLWILSDAEAGTGGTWTEILQPTYADKPHARSGCSLSVYQDEVLVLGGYFTFRANRFQRPEATVLHDLWSINLANPSPVWTRIKLAGIPPPIRCGMASCLKDKKLYLFGGVVDLDGPAGKTISTFHNDLFVLNLETKRFFPILLKKKSKKSSSSKNNKELLLQQQTSNSLAAAHNTNASSGGSDDLATEINKAIGKKITGGDDVSDSDSDEEEEEEEEEESSDDDDHEQDESEKHHDTKSVSNNNTATSASAAAAATSSSSQHHPPSATAELLPEISALTLSDGRILPCPRMNSMLAVTGHQLVIFGGVFEAGKREIALSDVFSLNMNTLDTFIPLLVQDVKNVPWKGEEAEGDGNSDAGSWEDGSTVAPEMLDALMEDLDEDEEDEDENANNKKERDHEEDEDEDDEGNTAPNLLAQKIAAGNVNANAAAASAVEHHNDFGGERKSVRGKIGKGHHLEQLKQQLGSGSIVPTPTLEESPQQFFERTAAFWLDSAARDIFELKSESEANRKQRMKIKRTAQECSRMRYTEARALLKQIAETETLIKQEHEALREHLRQRQAHMEEEDEYV